MEKQEQTIFRQLSQQVEEVDLSVSERRLTRKEGVETLRKGSVTVIKTKEGQANCCQLDKLTTVTSRTREGGATLSNDPPGVGNTANVHAADLVAPAGSREEHLRRVQLSLRVLELGSLRQVELPSALRRRGGPSAPGARGTAPRPQAGCPRCSCCCCCWWWCCSCRRCRCRRRQCGRRWRFGLCVGKEGVRGLRGQEGELGRDATGTWRAAEKAAELAEREAIHPSLCRRKTRGSLC